MATNIPPANYNIKSFSLNAVGPEVDIQLEGAMVLRYIKLECQSAADVFISFTSGGCHSVLDRWLIKSGQSLELEDIAYTLKGSGHFCYALGGAAGVLLQVIYAQA
jgi:hypothetical protein